MLLGNEESVKVLDEFLSDIKSRGFDRALEVAGGGGQLSADYLLKHYAKVDYFDQCQEAVR